MDFLFSSQLLTFIIGIAALIFVHELGHFFAARLLKIEVEEFGLGLPPKLVKLFEAGGTEFTLNWIPLGGFVRLKGENDPQVDGGFAAASPWRRLGVLFAGPAANLITGFILAIALVLTSGVSVPDKVVIYSVQEGSPAGEAGLLEDDLILAVNGISIDSTARMEEMIISNAGKPVEIQILRDGEPQTIYVELNKESRSLGTTYSDGTQILIEGIIAGSPAEAAGLLPGDRIMAINGVDISSAQQFEAIIARSDGGEITISYQRDGEAHNTSTELGERTLALGIGYNNARREVGLSEAIQSGSSDFSMIVRSITTLPVQLIRGDVGPDEARPIGYVGMFSIYQELESPLFFFMLISISLGIFNLLPIPALDGGRIALTLPEIFLRRRVPARYENIIHMVGFIILILIMVWVNINDILNPITIPR